MEPAPLSSRRLEAIVPPGPTASSTRRYGTTPRPKGGIQDRCQEADAGQQNPVARAFYRKAQWRLDFVAAMNSKRLHAPQEASRILGEAIDYARQGQAASLAAAP